MAGWRQGTLLLLALSALQLACAYNKVGAAGNLRRVRGALSPSPPPAAARRHRPLSRHNGPDLRARARLLFPAPLTLLHLLLPACCRQWR